MGAGNIALLLFFLLASSSGVGLNMFIAVVSYRTWLRDGFHHHPQGLLLFSIGLSSTIFAAYRISIDISPYLRDVSSYTICDAFMYLTFCFCIFFSMCQTSWLCSFYCIKLVSFQHRIIQVLKSRLPSILPWIMAGTAVICGMLLILLSSLIYISVPVDDTDKRNFCRRINDTYVFHIMIITNGINFLLALPFLHILVSLSCTTIALVQHVQRMQGTLRLDRSHLEAHIDAAKTMILLLALNVSFYFSKLMIDWKMLSFIWVSVVICFLFWPLQALILIFRTKKLYKSFICSFQRRISEKM